MFTLADLSSYAFTSSHEWLVTNGIGGYAAGTISGAQTRRYHGHLIAALKPPAVRTLLVPRLDDTVVYGSFRFPLSANAWHSGAREYVNLRYLTGFRREGTTPVWAYEREGLRLEKRLWMAHGENTTYLRYDVLQASEPVQLRLKTMANYRSHHSDTHADGWRMKIDKLDAGIRVTAYHGAVPYYIFAPGAEFTERHEWYYNYDMAVERMRGMTDYEDHLYAARIVVNVDPGASLTVVLSTEEDVSLDGQAAYAAHREREDALIAQAVSSVQGSPVEPLVLAADQTIIARSTDDLPAGRSVVAGYPWFLDWGRDTMIALPGLTLPTGRAEDAKTILRTYARYVDEGMIPNRFPDGGEAPEYNTVDATLWYVEATRAIVEATGDDDLLRELFPTLQQIFEWHMKGTRYGIGVDEADGLLRAGEPGLQLTWMDAKVGDWVVTPRRGKPVEVNALWYNLLCSMAAFAERLGEDPEPYNTMANRVQASFNRFWSGEHGYLYDVLDSPGDDGEIYDDASLRPNQIFAVSLYHSPLPPEQQQAVLAVVGEHLLTPRGLRSLTAEDPAYVPHYIGDLVARDGAYHQGTVWAWLIGPYASAHLRVHQDKAAARALIMPLIEEHLDQQTVGSIAEIFDGDPPHTPRGAHAQAWSIAEVLRIWAETAPDAEQPGT